MQLPMDKALFSKLWCVKETAFGAPVVPLRRKTGQIVPN
jgi:hypothetical protein